MTILMGGLPHFVAEWVESQVCIGRTQHNGETNKTISFYFQ